jgi:hypothetical protein
MDADGHARAICLITLYTVHMNHPLLAVHLCDLAIAPLVLPSNDPYFVILSYWK